MLCFDTQASHGRIYRVTGRGVSLVYVEYCNRWQIFSFNPSYSYKFKTKLDSQIFKLNKWRENTKTEGICYLLVLHALALSLSLFLKRPPKHPLVLIHYWVHVKCTMYQVHVNCTMYQVHVKCTMYQVHLNILCTSIFH